MPPTERLRLVTESAGAGCRVARSALIRRDTDTGMLPACPARTRTRQRSRPLRRPRIPAREPRGAPRTATRNSRAGTTGAPCRKTTMAISPTLV
jgi:hypothetical protein